MLSKTQDFVIPVLQIVDSLGGRAWLPDIETSFFIRFGKDLDPKKDWHRMRPSRSRECWRDFCTTRVAYYFLRPQEYVTTELHGASGAMYVLTDKGKAKAREQLRAAGA